MHLERRKDPQFSQPIRQILSMLVILGLVGVGSYFAYPSVSPIFLASPYLNGTIVGVFVVGVLVCFWQMLVLIRAVSWIEGFALDRPGHEMVTPPRMLAPLSALLRGRGARRALTSSSSRSIQDSVAVRLDEARDITRYLVNLLIFLGLLGTFYGLATTVPAVVDTIRSLGAGDGEGVAVFDRLMTGLEDQLGGMGTAFASSLLGLAGSLVVGLLDLFAGHGQNRFYSELEEWLSSITRISLTSGDGDSVGSGGDAGIILQVMEQNALQLETLKDVVMRAEEKRFETDTKINQLTDAIYALTTQIGSGTLANGHDTAVLDRLAAAEERIALAVEDRDDGGLDAETRARLRNIDIQLVRVVEEMAAGRQDAVAELRAELAELNRTLTRAIEGET